MNPLDRLRRIRQQSQHPAPAPCPHCGQRDGQADDCPANDETDTYIDLGDLGGEGGY
jgi:hypothetical protein